MMLAPSLIAVYISKRHHTRLNGTGSSQGCNKQIICPDTLIDSFSVDSILSSVCFCVPPFKNSCWLNAYEKERQTKTYAHMIQ